MLLNVQLNVVQVELSQSLQLDAKGPNGVLFTYSVRTYFIGSIINVGVTPLRCHFQHYFFAKK